VRWPPTLTIRTLGLGFSVNVSKPDLSWQLNNDEIVTFSFQYYFICVNFFPSGRYFGSVLPTSFLGGIDEGRVAGELYLVGFHSGSHHQFGSVWDRTGWAVRPNGGTGA
jgi:hypothetical protein